MLTVREEIIQFDLFYGKEQYTLLTVREEIIQFDLYCGKEQYTLLTVREGIYSLTCIVARNSALC